MIWYYLTIIVFLIIMIIEYKKHNKVIAAPVVYPVMWVLSILGLVALGKSRWLVKPTTFLVLIAGYVMFCIGFELVYAKLRNKVETVEIEKTVRTSRLRDNIITMGAIFIGLLYVFELSKYFDLNNIYGSWRDIHLSYERNELVIPYVLIVLRYYNRCALWYLCLRYFLCLRSELSDKKDRIQALIRVIIVLISVIPIIFYDISKNDFLFALLPIVFEYLIISKSSAKETIRVGGICIVGFALFSALFTCMEANEWLSIENTQIPRFLHYLSSSIKAFDGGIDDGLFKWVTVNGHGRYTFSAILGIADRMLGTDLSPEVVMGLQQVGDLDSTNVYTVYAWTSLDFGIIYSVGIHFVLGCAYGYLYHSIENENIISIYVYSIMSYPLVMMFFQDQYFSIGQSWIILFGFSIIIWLIAKVRQKLNENISDNGRL